MKTQYLVFSQYAFSQWKNTLWDTLDKAESVAVDSVNKDRQAYYIVEVIRKCSPKTEVEWERPESE